MSKPTHGPGSGINWSAVFAFPNPVNEYAARITAGLVVLLAGATLLAGSGWGLVLIAAGFWLRVLFGPRISPLALLSVKVLAPRLGRARLVPGPPKRFAQGMGTVVSTTALVLFAAGAAPAAWIVACGPHRGGLARSLRRILPGLRDLRRPAAPRPDPGGDLRGLQQRGAQAVVTPTSRSAMPRMTFRRLECFEPFPGQALLAVEGAQDVSRDGTR